MDLVIPAIPLLACILVRLLLLYLLPSQWNIEFWAFYLTVHLSFEAAAAFSNASDTFSIDFAVRAAPSV